MTDVKWAGVWSRALFGVRVQISAGQALRLVQGWSSANPAEGLAVSPAPPRDSVVTSSSNTSQSPWHLLQNSHHFPPKQSPGRSSLIVVAGKDPRARRLEVWFRHLAAQPMHLSTTRIQSTNYQSNKASFEAVSVNTPCDVKSVNAPNCSSTTGTRSCIGPATILRKANTVRTAAHKLSSRSVPSAVHKIPSDV